MISRRGFIGAASAFAGLGLLPSWKAFAQRRQIDLTPFVADDSFRWSIDKPFAQDGMVYATDARILVRTLLADAPKLDEPARLPAASKLPWWEAADLKWKPWPKSSLFSDAYKWGETCPKCWGNGGFGNVRRCANCDGDGTIPFPDNADDDFHSLDCKACCTSGRLVDVRCDYCDGSGQTMRPALQRVGSLVIAGEYDCRVRLLGDVEYAIVDEEPFPASAPGSRNEVIRFRGDGFDGLLMPMFDRGVRQLPEKVVEGAMREVVNA